MDYNNPLYHAIFEIDDYYLNLEVVEYLHTDVFICRRRGGTMGECVLYRMRTLAIARSTRRTFANLGDDIFPRDAKAGKCQFFVSVNNQMTRENGYGVLVDLPEGRGTEIYQWIDTLGNLNPRYIMSPDHVSPKVPIDFVPTVKSVLLGIKYGIHKIHSFDKCNSILRNFVRVTPLGAVLYIPPHLQDESGDAYLAEIKSFEDIVDSVVNALGENPLMENVRLFRWLLYEVRNHFLPGLTLSSYRELNHHVIHTPLIWDSAYRDLFSRRTGQLYNNRKDTLSGLDYDRLEANFTYWYQKIGPDEEFLKCLCHPTQQLDTTIHHTQMYTKIQNKRYLNSGGLVLYRRNIEEHPGNDADMVETIFYSYWPEFCSVVHYVLVCESLKPRGLISNKQIALIKL